MSTLSQGRKSTLDSCLNTKQISNLPSDLKSAYSTQLGLNAITEPNVKLKISSNGGKFFRDQYRVIFFFEKKSKFSIPGLFMLFFLFC